MYNILAVFDINQFIEIVTKLLLTAVLSGVIGFERESHGQSAGFRTYILVGMAGCLMMMVSLYMVELHETSDYTSAVRLDPGRIASYTLAGMGFLGAGAIITGRGSVKGLTTAAGMWLITGVGLAVGCGYFLPAIIVTLFSLFSLYVLRHTKAYVKRDTYKMLTLVFDDRGGHLNLIHKTFDKYPFIKVEYIGFHRKLDHGTIDFKIKITVKEGLEWRQLTDELTELPGIKEISLEEGTI